MTYGHTITIFEELLAIAVVSSTFVGQTIPVSVSRKVRGFHAACRVILEFLKQACQRATVSLGNVEESFFKNQKLFYCSPDFFILIVVKAQRMKQNGLPDIRRRRQLATEELLR